MTRWYLVYTKPRKEGVAAENLKRQGYEAYLPLIQQSRRRRARWSEAIEPLFPRYLFIRFTLGIDNVGSIRYTTGVSGLVRFTDEPAVVADHIVESIRRRADSENGLHRSKAPRFVPGDTVVIDTGPLARMEGVFVAETGQERVAILLHMLGRDNVVSAERAILRLA